jgi:hypothetical protein
MATTVTVTVQATGGDYTTIQAAESGEQKNLVTADEILVIDIEAGTYNESVDVGGWTTDSTRYVRFKAQTGDEHGGVQGAGVKIASSVSFNFPLDCSQDYTQFFDLEFEQTNGSNAAFHCISCTGVRGERLIADSNGSNCFDMRNASTSSPHTLINCLAIGANKGFDLANGSSNNWYNCTSIDATTVGFQCQAFSTMNVLVQNCVTYTAVGDGFYTGAKTDSASDYNAAHDTRAPGANSVDNITSAAFEDYAGGDYAPADSGVLDGAGTDLSGIFTDDITGTTRSTWDIGAFITASTGATLVSVPQTTETDTAQSISPTVGAISEAVGQSSETDTAQSISPSVGAVSVEIGQATETDSAFSVLGSFSSQVEALDPWLYWKIDEASGALQDSTANNNDSVAQSISTYQDTNIVDEAGAATFNGASDYAKDTAATGYVADGVMSAVVAMRYNDTLPASGTIFHVGDFGNGSNRGFRFYFVSGVLRIQGWASSNYRTVDLTWQPTIGANHLVGIVLTTTDLKLYVDGVLEDTTAHSWTYNNNTSSPPVTLGSAQSSGESDFLEADLGHFALFNQELSAANMSDLAEYLLVSSVNATVGQATETDLAQSFTVSVGAVSVEAGLASEADTAQSITATFGGNSVSVGQVTETDTSQSISPSLGAVSVSLGLVTETDTAFEISASIAGTELGLPTETDEAFSITPSLAGEAVQVETAYEVDFAIEVSVLGGSNTTIKLPVNRKTNAEPGECWVTHPGDVENYSGFVEWAVLTEEYAIMRLGGLYDGRNLSKSDPAVAGQFWNDDGILKVSNG